VQISKHWTINSGLFRGNGVPKASLQPGEPEVHTCEGSSRDFPGEEACVDHRVASVSRLASRNRVAILSDIIIIKYLNYYK
jgi:hypothetical protein